MQTLRLKALEDSVRVVNRLNRPINRPPTKTLTVGGRFIERLAIWMRASYNLL
jgi:hypothetical protein